LPFSLQDFLCGYGLRPRRISFLLSDSRFPIAVADVGGLGLQLGIALLDELMTQQEGAE